MGHGDLAQSWLRSHAQGLTVLGHCQPGWPCHVGLLLLGLRQSSLGPWRVLLHPNRSRPWLQAPTETSGHGRGVHTHGGHWGHLGHLVLDWPLKSLYMCHLGLRLTMDVHCLLTSHCPFHGYRWAPWKGRLSSLLWG